MLAKRRDFHVGFLWAVGGMCVVLLVYSYSLPARVQCRTFPFHLELRQGSKQVVKHWLLNLGGFSPNLQPLLDGCLSLAASHMCLSLGHPSLHLY